VKEELEKKMAVLLGGRAAEHIVFNHLSTGAADDLNKVTEIARSMVTRYGMVPELGHVTYDSEPTSMLGPGMPGLARRDYSNETAREIDAAIRKIVEQAFLRARAILERNRTVLDEGAALLLSKETLAEADLTTLFARVVKDNGAPARSSLPPASA
jgi:cell division protease FtsH